MLEEGGLDARDIPDLSRSIRMPFFRLHVRTMLVRVTCERMKQGIIPN